MTTLEKLDDIFKKKQEKMTTLEKLDEIFNWWENQLKDQWEARKNNDCEKIHLHGRMYELNRVRDKLKAMTFEGQIKIIINIEF